MIKYQPWKTLLSQKIIHSPKLSKAICPLSKEKLSGIKEVGTFGTLVLYGYCRLLYTIEIRRKYGKEGTSSRKGFF
jgi:hypothetical protein